MKKNYKQPQMAVETIATAHLMGDPLLGSPTGPQPAPRRDPIE